MAAPTIWAGQGNDTIADSGAGTIYGNEGDDLIILAAVASGGPGADTFRTGGGSITDLNWAEDRIDTPATITHVANVGTVGGNTFIGAAIIALIASQIMAGECAAVQYDYQGRTYLTIGSFNGGQISPTWGIIDITGVTGTITTADFV